VLRGQSVFAVVRGKSEPLELCDLIYIAWQCVELPCTSDPGSILPGTQQYPEGERLRPTHAGSFRSLDIRLPECAPQADGSVLARGGKQLTIGGKGHGINLQLMTTQERGSSSITCRILSSDVPPANGGVPPAFHTTSHPGRTHWRRS